MAERMMEDEFDKIRREHKARDAASPEGKQKAAEAAADLTMEKIKKGETSPGEPDDGPLQPKGMLNPKPSVLPGIAKGMLKK